MEWNGMKWNDMKLQIGKWDVDVPLTDDDDDDNDNWAIKCSYRNITTTFLKTKEKIFDVNLKNEYDYYFIRSKTHSVEYSSIVTQN